MAPCRCAHSMLVQASSDTYSCQFAQFSFGTACSSQAKILWLVRQTDTHTNIHTLTHTCTRMCTRSSACARTHTHCEEYKKEHAQTSTYTHTHTHTNSPTGPWWPGQKINIYICARCIRNCGWTTEYCSLFHYLFIYIGDVVAPCRRKVTCTWQSEETTPSERWGMLTLADNAFFSSSQAFISNRTVFFWYRKKSIPTVIELVILGKSKLNDFFKPTDVFFHNGPVPLLSF